MKSKKFIKSILFLLMVSFASSQSVYSLEVGTHEAINERVAKGNLNGISFDNYLKNNIGIAGGINEYFNDKKVFDWLKIGGSYEDKPPGLVIPYLRSVNHFHNPLTEEGFSGFFYGLLLSGDSSVLWAQKPIGTQSPLGDYVLGGNYSWHDTREYFYRALTSINSTQRGTFFAKTFRGIGQIMHLVEDMSVPAHTRDDSHMAGYHYELAVDKFRKSDDPVYTNAIASPRFFDPSILALTPNPLAPIPIAKIFDTDRYDGLNASAGINQGLAEYTNANFFSEDTIFSDAYSYPNELSTDLQSYINQNKLPEIVLAEDNIPDTNFYIKKTGDGETIEHFVKPGYLTKEAVDAGNPIYVRTFILDDSCYKDYASLLIPRAVGYSAGLLNYFFRGNIEISIPTNGIYAQTDDPSNGFKRITLLAKNITPNNEEMTNGSIELVVRYKLAQADPFQSSAVATDTEFTYVTVPANDANSIPSGISTELTFGTGQTTIIPLWATNVYLQVVFKGTLGNEVGAVAVGLKDISEPTPIDVYNNMDKVCLYGNWYTAGSQAAIDQVDPDHDGIPGWDIYAHNLQDAYLKISSISNPINASPSDFTFYKQFLAAGPPSYRAYVLSDYEYTFNLSDYATAQSTTTNDTWTHVIISGNKTASAIKNQTDYNVESQTECDTVGATAPCEIRYYPLFYPFRGINIWGSASYIIDNPKYPVDTNCSWDLLP